MSMRVTTMSFRDLTKEVDLKFKYQSLYRGDYTDREMPTWLKPLAIDELYSFVEETYKRVPRIRGSLVDLGCGDGRVIRAILSNKIMSPMFIMRVKGAKKPNSIIGIDIIDKPKNFPQEAIYCEKRHVSELLDQYKGTANAVTSFGLNVHLSEEQAWDYFNLAHHFLRKGGILVWQRNHRRHFYGWKLHYADKYLRYTYNNAIQHLNGVLDFKLENKITNKISDIWVYRKQ